MFGRCRRCDQAHRMLERERAQWMQLTRDLNEQIMMLSGKALPPPVVPVEGGERLAELILLDPGPENGP